MRPAAVCNHSGPRRAAREAAGESARGGVDGGCSLGPRDPLGGGGGAPRRRLPRNSKPPSSLTCSVRQRLAVSTLPRLHPGDRPAVKPPVLPE
ncbi:unnamed protein product [Rangifer tarandus platyrhynchus]|uniref:Uncharacterized protein n=1 Tax=Rangifer tarandus platyrhynchus TaxID=3082113 RepID=A0AC59YH73_RANTA